MRTTTGCKGTQQVGRSVDCPHLLPDRRPTCVTPPAGLGSTAWERTSASYTDENHPLEHNCPLGHHLIFLAKVFLLTRGHPLSLQTFVWGRGQTRGFRGTL